MLDNSSNLFSIEISLYLQNSINNKFKLLLPKTSGCQGLNIPSIILLPGKIILFNSNYCSYPLPLQ